jgi:Tfp pilus assembly PilM family ATPase
MTISISKVVGYFHDKIGIDLRPGSILYLQLKAIKAEYQIEVISINSTEIRFRTLARNPIRENSPLNLEKIATYERKVIESKLSKTPYLKW